MTDKALTIKNKNDDLSLQLLIDDLVEQLEKTDLPNKVIEATELLLSGFPTHLVAKKIGVNTSTIKGWITKYPPMAMILANSGKLMSKYRLSKLEQQFVDAVNKSEEILKLNLDGTTEDGIPVDSKTLTVIAAQARYIIGIFAGQKTDITVTHEVGDTILKARSEALDYVANQLNNEDVIETVVRVIDSDKDTSGPIYSNDGESNFGTIGTLDVNDTGTLCSFCGNRYKSFAKHLLTKHDLSVAEYEITYSIKDGEIRKADDLFRTKRRTA